MTITTADCKNFIKENSESLGYSSNGLKRTRKYKHGNLILRDFVNDNGECITISEDEQHNLSFYEQAQQPAKQESSTQIHSNWLKLITDHFSDPCYKNDEYSIEQMLDESLAALQHGMQHNSYKKKDIYFKSDSSTTFLIIPNITSSSDKFIAIPLNDLKAFGYEPKAKQSGYDFVDENWNWY